MFCASAAITEFRESFKSPACALARCTNKAERPDTGRRLCRPHVLAIAVKRTTPPHAARGQRFGVGNGPQWEQLSDQIVESLLAPAPGAAPRRGTGSAKLAAPAASPAASLVALRSRALSRAEGRRRSAATSLLANFGLRVAAAKITTCCHASPGRVIDQQLHITAPKIPRKRKNS